MRSTSCRWMASRAVTPIKQINGNCGNEVMNQIAFNMAAAIQQPVFGGYFGILRVMHSARHAATTTLLLHFQKQSCIKALTTMKAKVWLILLR